VAVGYYGIDERSASLARERIEAGFDRIEVERAHGDYLVGDGFSVADLTAAALVAPLLMPPGFPWRLRAGPHPAVTRLQQELGRHPAADWVGRIYARHRRPGTRAPARETVASAPHD
jgi:glutathione S-transferase